jgi:hypothetical protein
VNRGAEEFVKTRHLPFGWSEKFSYDPYRRWYHKTEEMVEMSDFKKVISVILVAGVWGTLWGVFIPEFFLGRGAINPVAGSVAFLITCLLGYRLQWHETSHQKVIIRILIFLFIFSPIIGLCIFPSTEPVSLVDKAREGATKENLDLMRSVINDYYKENGIYPITLDIQVHTIETSALPPFVPNYLELIPKVHLRREISHIDSNEVLIVSTEPGQKIQPEQITDEGGWIYNPSNGDIRINCSHKDLNGIPYYEW